MLVKCLGKPLMYTYADIVTTVTVLDKDNATGSTDAGQMLRKTTDVHICTHTPMCHHHTSYCEYKTMGTRPSFTHTSQGNLKK